MCLAMLLFVIFNIEETLVVKEGNDHKDSGSFVDLMKTPYVCKILVIYGI
jgi:hypothetical protein